eukprot:gnl/MRDRNA2_/MRDRNA2_112244_c0_seq1.p1 gnl/MRDRNA2_/MRDRNA2_112244_c0~~gnl/MRDRNA2_/MRDRNA2_112244_c0_seq1.p1  ORF type:complete len:163 (+),score=23.07 gnl/MRDRNA2_/MRDRNA2_112244_c0_seq1:131-619(+)
MAFDSIKGLSPSMKAKYWGEAIKREGGGLMVNPLNTAEILVGPSGNPFLRNLPPARNQYAPWKLLSERHDLAAGSPSPIVRLARQQYGARLDLPKKDFFRSQRSASTPALTSSSTSMRTTKSEHEGLTLPAIHTGPFRRGGTDGGGIMDQLNRLRSLHGLRP